jgi:hypothetical protein
MTAMSRLSFAVALSLALAACGANDATAPQATPSDVGAAVVAAAEASVATHPLCDTAKPEEVDAVVGGHHTKMDVIDEETLHTLDCIFLDPQDIYNGFSIRFVTNERLIKAGSNWSSANAYFEEWSRGGDVVADLGDGAAWVELPKGLLVHRGDHAVLFSADKADLTNADVRARFETLARQVIARLPQ